MELLWKRLLYCEGSHDSRPSPASYWAVISMGVGQFHTRRIWKNFCRSTEGAAFGYIWQMKAERMLQLTPPR